MSSQMVGLGCETVLVRGWWLVAVAVIVPVMLAKSASGQEFFEVSMSTLHGQAIQLGIKWDATSDSGRFADLTIHTTNVSSSCPDIFCQKLAVNAVSVDK